MLGFVLGELKEVYVNGNTRQYHSEIQDGGGQNGNTCIHIRTWNISASIHDSNEIQTASPMFWGSDNTERLVGILSDVWVCRKSKMRPLTGNRYEITYISVHTHDSNEISTATPTFSRFSNSVVLVPYCPT